MLVLDVGALALEWDTWVEEEFLTESTGHHMERFRGNHERVDAVQSTEDISALVACGKCDGGSLALAFANSDNPFSIFSEHNVSNVSRDHAELFFYDPLLTSVLHDKDSDEATFVSECKFAVVYGVLADGGNVNAMLGEYYGFSLRFSDVVEVEVVLSGVHQEVASASHDNRAPASTSGGGVSEDDVGLALRLSLFYHIFVL